jgi:hypothetical protein
MRQYDVRRERGQFRRVSANAGGIGRGPTGVDARPSALRVLVSFFSDSCCLCSFIDSRL